MNLTDEKTPEMNEYNPMQRVKRQFFAMRNGIIADTMRKAGSPFRVVFGLNLPQIVEIAAQTGVDDELAEALWANSTTRESMLMAPMIADRTAFDIDRARRWVATVPAAEVADILCHRLLRHMPYAWQLAEELADNAPTQYTGLRLVLNLLASDPEKALLIGQRHSSTPLGRQIIEQANDTIEYTKPC